MNMTFLRMVEGSSSIFDYIVDCMTHLGPLKKKTNAYITDDWHTLSTYHIHMMEEEKCIKFIPNHSKSSKICKTDIVP